MMATNDVVKWGEVEYVGNFLLFKVWKKRWYESRDNLFLVVVR